MKGRHVRESSPETDASVEGPTSVGLYLAGQRRLRGISIDDLAARTRIPRRNIERLEAGAFDAAPDGFSRGFVRTIAQALGLDADEAVMRLMREPGVDDAELARVRWRMLIARGALAAVLAAALVLVGKLVVTLLAPATDSAPPAVLYRRDPVRALAAEAPPAPVVPSEPAPPEPAPEVD